MTDNRIRLILGEECSLIREGLAELLVRDFNLLGSTGDGNELVELAVRHAPDVVVTSVRLEGLSGIDAALQIRKARNQTQVVMLSAGEDAPTVERALQAGARGFLTHRQSYAAVRDGLVAVSRGGVHLSPDVSQHVLHGYLHGKGAPRHALTERELEVLHLIAEGLTGKQIAERMGLAPKTVDNHRTRIMDKLDIHTTGGLVRFAFRSGMV